MIIALDMGNTNIVVGVLENKNVLRSFRIATDKKKTTVDFLVQLKTMFDFYKIDLSECEGAILSSVVPELTLQLKEAIEKLLDKEVLLIGPGVKTGLNIKIDNPTTLGSDRVCDAVSAIEEYPLPIIIIDMGTATTLSIIDENKTHIGGMIIPGVKTSLNALSQNASQLPFISIEAPKKVIGKNTVDCMKSGIVYSNACMIDGLIDRINEELNMKATVICTGGNAKTIINYCKSDIIYEENLLLKGLYYIYMKNRG